MNLARLMQLSPEAARNRLDTGYRNETTQFAEGIALIGIIDQRRDYREAGYSCMRSYCMERLGMTEDQAAKRVQIARVAMRFPQMFAYFADGRLGVSAAAALAPYLTAENVDELLALSAGQTREEIIRRLAAHGRRAAAPSTAPAREVNVETESCQHAPGHVESLADLCPPVTTDMPSCKRAPGHAAVTKRGRITPSSTGDYDVRLSITEEERALLRRAEDLLGHAVPSGDPAEIYARAMQLFVAHLEKQRFGAKLNANAATAVAKGRRPTTAISGFVHARDGDCCTYVGPGGNRCQETRRLECDHIVPWSQGGLTTAVNLRLLCRTHNQFEAEQALGKEYVESRREMAERARACDRAARAKATPCPPVRSEARQAIYNDLVGGLCNLGFPEPRAQECAKLADAMPNAPIEECMKFVLQAIGRDGKRRGERVTRGTT